VPSPARGWGMAATAGNDSSVDREAVDREPHRSKVGGGVLTAD
jgi:hypothetical protein